MTTTSCTFSAEEWVPAGRDKFRLDEIAEFLEVTVTHLYNLVAARELKVPKKNVASAPSRGSILVPRGSLVAFVSRRCSSEKLKRQRKVRRRSRV